MIITHHTIERLREAGACDDGLQYARTLLGHDLAGALTCAPRQWRGWVHETACRIAIAPHSTEYSASTAPHWTACERREIAPVIAWLGPDPS